MFNFFYIIKKNNFDKIIFGSKLYNYFKSTYVKICVHIKNEIYITMK